MFLGIGLAFTLLFLLAGRGAARALDRTRCADLPQAWFDRAMPDEPKRIAPAEEALGEQRALIASVEELRALLAPLEDEDRALVLDLASRLAHPTAES